MGWMIGSALLCFVLAGALGKETHKLATVLVLIAIGFVIIGIGLAQ